MDQLTLWRDLLFCTHLDEWDLEICATCGKFMDRTEVDKAEEYNCGCAR